MSLLNYKEQGVWHEASIIKGDRGPAGPAGPPGAKGDTGDAGLQFMAQTFGINTPYNKGELVIYNGFLYVCIEPHQGPWTTNHFKRTLISDSMQQDYDANLTTVNKTTTAAINEINSKTRFLTIEEIDRIWEEN